MKKEIINNIHVMENTHTPENNSAREVSKDYVNVKIKKPKPIVIAIVVAIILIGVALFFAKGHFIVATVNGSPISRWSVIQELEKQGGKQVLASLINKKLIESEIKKSGVTVTSEEVDAEVQKIETQIVATGRTLDELLAKQNMSRMVFLEEIKTQKLLEKILVDTLVVTPEEIDAYIKTYSATPPAGTSMEKFREKISEQLRQQKFQEEGAKWSTSLTESAKIIHYFNY